MKHMQTFEKFLGGTENKSQLEIQESTNTVGNVSVEKTKGGWLLKTPSVAGRGTQVIAILDDQVKELVKILTEG